MQYFSRNILVHLCKITIKFFCGLIGAILTLLFAAFLWIYFNFFIPDYIYVTNRQGNTLTIRCDSFVYVYTDSIFSLDYPEIRPHYRGDFWVEGPFGATRYIEINYSDTKAQWDVYLSTDSYENTLDSTACRINMGSSENKGFELVADLDLEESYIITSIAPQTTIVKLSKLTVLFEKIKRKFT